MLYIKRGLYSDRGLTDTEPASDRMRIPSFGVRSVNFLARKDEHGELINIGTAFMVGIRHKGGFPTYLVTAKHCIVPMQNFEKDIYVRFNGPRGADTIVFNQWTFSDDPGVDAAVAVFDIDEVAAQHSTISLDGMFIYETAFATDDVIQRCQVGMGDEVFVIGLFTQYWGNNDHLVPLARLGSIAAEPNQRLAHQDSHEIPYGLRGEYLAHLVELHSIGGLSGSPVGVNLDPLHYLSLGLTPSRGDIRPFLLGLISGHWPESVENMDSSNPLDLIRQAERGTVNTGIAFVTPIQKVLDIFQQPELVAEREARVSRRRPNNVVMDGYGAVPTSL